MNVLKSLLNLLYPPRCPFCGSLLSPYHQRDKLGAPLGDSFKVVQKLETILCSHCLTVLPWLENNCSRCAHPLPKEGEACPLCSSFNFAFSNCCAVGRYEGKFRVALHNFKYRGQRSLASPLGKLVALKLRNMPWCPSLEAVIPVPLSTEKLLLRGYNQAALLAAVVGQELNLPVHDLLKRTRDTRSQAGLKRWERRVNLRGSFSCQQVSRARTVLLIDDILTSGSTAQEASLVLKKAGCKHVNVAVFAR